MKVVVVQIAFHGPKAEELSQHQLRLPKDSCIEHVLQELRKQLPSSYASAPLRLLETYMSKIFKVGNKQFVLMSILWCSQTSCTQA